MGRQREHYAAASVILMECWFPGKLCASPFSVHASFRVQPRLRKRVSWRHGFDSFYADLVRLSGAVLVISPLPLVVRFHPVGFSLAVRTILL